MPKTVATGQQQNRAVRSNKYDIVPEGEYYAVVTNVKLSMFGAKFKDKMGYDVEKFTPTVVLLNENQTTIDRQDLAIGAVNETGAYTTEYFNTADDDMSKIWAGYDLAKGNFGARNFMFATGMLNEDGLVNFNELAIVDLVLRVNVKTREYSYNGRDYTENVITFWDSVSTDDLDSLSEAGIDTSKWVTYHMCVLLPDEDSNRQPVIVPLTFTSEAAFDIFYTRMFDDPQWVNPVGELLADGGGLEYWDAVDVVAQATTVEAPISDDIPM